MDEELLLNPPPKSYRVPFPVKCLFMVILSLGFGAYLYMIIDRRLSENRALLDNQMEALKLVPKALPNLTLNDPKSGSKHSLKTEITGWTLLSLWATSIPACQEAMPSLELLQQKLKGKLNVIAVSVDDDVTPVREFIANNKPSFTVLWDKQKLCRISFGTQLYPETFLVSPDGQLVTQFTGGRDWASPTSIEYFQNLLRN